MYYSVEGLSEVDEAGNTVLLRVQSTDDVI